MDLLPGSSAKKDKPPDYEVILLGVLHSSAALVHALLGYNSNALAVSILIVGH
jgi:hypothetical protein